MFACPMFDVGFSNINRYSCLAGYLAIATGAYREMSCLVGDILTEIDFYRKIRKNPNNRHYHSDYVFKTINGYTG